MILSWLLHEHSHLREFLVGWSPDVNMRV